MAARLAAELRREGGQHRRVPDLLAHVEQEAGVRDDAALGRRGEAGGEQTLQVDLGLEGLDHREGVLDPAALRRDRADRLLLHGHLRARARLHLPGERREVEPRRRHQVDVGHARHDVGDRRRELLGLADTGLVRLDALLEPDASLAVTLDHRDEVREELRLGILGDLRPRGVEGRERRHRSLKQPRHRRQRFCCRGHVRAVEHVRVGIELGVEHPGRLHGPEQTVRVGVGHDDRPLLCDELPVTLRGPLRSRITEVISDFRIRATKETHRGRPELADLDQARTGRVGLPVADDGVAAHQIPDPLRRLRDLLRPGVGRVGLVVVVADMDLDTVGLEGLDGRDQLHRRRRVDENDAARALGDRGQDGLSIRGGEELRAENEAGGNLESKHVGFLLVLCTGSGWTPEVAIPRPIV